MSVLLLTRILNRSDNKAYSAVKHGFLVEADEFNPGARWKEEYVATVPEPDSERWKFCAFSHDGGLTLSSAGMKIVVRVGQNNPAGRRIVWAEGIAHLDIFWYESSVDKGGGVQGRGPLQTFRIFMHWPSTYAITLLTAVTGADLTPHNRHPRLAPSLPDSVSHWRFQ